ncbi:glycosyltransferase family 4 protein [Bradyrhizobium rifense]|uniref:Glycosyltransferase family 4 protein n=1 Tax=Bradyrhizobium rifense TaxID=515499 RepID=A0A5D3KBQ0_9BRAD|nr:glycosyltransferase family 4 protein [Bradyrhizobium rifense]TYL92027.1 glycosyltransferase family 4 protein [Bradyrhizobium rifense]
MVSARPLKVLIATPFGARQRGGIDRLTDLIVARIEQAHSARVQASRLVTRGPGPRAFAPFVFSWALVRFWLARKRGNVDLLHINVAADGSAIRKALLARFARRLGVPYVVHLHGSRFQEFWPAASPRVRAWIDPLFSESEAVIVLGNVWSKLVQTHVPQAEDRIVILPNATAPADLKRQPALEGPVRISFLGELGRRKGTPQLVEALGQLDRGLNWVATIAGNGQIQETRARAEELGIGHRVKVPGWLDARATNEVLQGSDIFVLPSFAENLPMSILEAFAYGVAVIATPVGAIADVISDGTNGLLVPTGNVDALASALRRLIVDGQFRDSLGAAAKNEHASKYEIGAYVTRMIEIWRGAAVR